MSISAKKSNELGVKRLALLHSRVNYLTYELKDGEEEEKQKTICNICSHKMDKLHHKDTKLYIQTYMKCSGIEWICQARKECCAAKRIRWNREELMSRSTYSFNISKTIREMDPRTALFTIDLFHYELCSEQQHMVKITQFEEQAAYRTYQPFKLLHEMFPLPPMGKEMVAYQLGPFTYPSPNIRSASLKQRQDHMQDYCIETLVQQCECNDSEMKDMKRCSTCKTPYTLEISLLKHPPHYEPSENSDMSETKSISSTEDEQDNKAEKLLEQPDWGLFFQLTSEEKKMLETLHNDNPNELKVNMVRLTSLLQVKSQDMLKYADIMSGIPGACHHCKMYKQLHPNREVHCSGHYDLDFFKYRMFQEKPYNMDKKILLNETILKCNTLEKYQRQLDKIFSVDFIERAIDIKLQFDNEVIDCYPNMSPYIAMYDALILRWYWPQVLKNKEEEDSSSSEEESIEEEDTSSSSNESFEESVSSFLQEKISETETDTTSSSSSSESFEIVSCTL